MSLSRNYEMGQEQTKRKRTRSTKKAGKRSRAASKMESQRQVAAATVTKLPAQQSTLILSPQLHFSDLLQLPVKRRPASCQIPFSKN